MRKKLVSLGLVVILVLIALLFLYRNFDGSGQVQNEYSLQLAFPNLVFSFPVGLVTPEDGTNRLFVIEQEGTIRVFDNSENTTSSSVFLD
ncbi:MAG TPA: glucose sorbosone dehydrogenase, partial [Candidatus Bathyarchaeia archaeon]